MTDYAVDRPDLTVALYILNCVFQFFLDSQALHHSIHPPSSADLQSPLLMLPRIEIAATCLSEEHFSTRLPLPARHRTSVQSRRRINVYALSHGGIALKKNLSADRPNQSPSKRIAPFLQNHFFASQNHNHCYFCRIYY